MDIELGKSMEDVQLVLELHNGQHLEDLLCIRSSLEGESF
jgi:hypothetical protein